MKHKLLTRFIVLAAITTFCAKSEDFRRRQEYDTADLMAKKCGKTYIANGKETNAVQLLPVVEINIGQALCTGTFISQDTILTAAHCFKGARNLATIKYGSHRLIANDIILDPDYEHNVENDLALIRLGNKQQVDTIPLCDFSLKKDDKAMIVGYGSQRSDALQGPFVKRVGYTQISAIKGGIVETQGQSTTTDGSGKNASTAEGDSGGPLLVEDSNKNLCVGAVTSRGVPVDGVDYAYYTNLKASAAESFLEANGLSYGASRTVDNDPSTNEVVLGGGNKQSQIDSCD